jgi:hypothetical protein
MHVLPLRLEQTSLATGFTTSLHKEHQLQAIWSLSLCLSCIPCSPEIVPISARDTCIKLDVCGLKERGCSTVQEDHLDSNRGAIPNSTVDLAKGALPYERAQLDIFPWVLLSCATNLCRPGISSNLCSGCLGNAQYTLDESFCSTNYCF